MYGRMQFADFVVSSALQALSRSLLKLAEQNGQLQPGDEKALTATAERLMSLWQMVQWSVGKLHFTRAQADLREIIELNAANRNPEAAAAERMLDRAEGKSRRMLGEIILDLSSPGVPPQSPDRLNALLQAESRRWREISAIRQIAQEDLVDHGMLRAFGKARDLNGKLDRNRKPDPGRQVSAKRLMIGSPAGRQNDGMKPPPVYIVSAWNRVFQGAWGRAWKRPPWSAFRSKTIRAHRRPDLPARPD